MKVYTIYIKENIIEISNSFLGKETIKVNDRIVSSKYSLFGTNHNFNLTHENNVSNMELNTKLTPHGVLIDLFENGKPIIESSKTNWLRFLSILAVVVLVISFYKYIIHFKS